MTLRVIGLAAFLSLATHLSSQTKTATKPPDYAETKAWIASHFGSLHGRPVDGSVTFEFISMDNCIFKFREHEAPSFVDSKEHTSVWLIPLADVDKVEVSDKSQQLLEFSTHSHGAKISFQYEFMSEPDLQDTARVLANWDETSISLLPRIQNAFTRAVSICRVEADKTKKPKNGKDGPF